MREKKVQNYAHRRRLLRNINNNAFIAEMAVINYSVLERVFKKNTYGLHLSHNMFFAILSVVKNLFLRVGACFAFAKSENKILNELKLSLHTSPQSQVNSCVGGGNVK